MAIGSDLMIGGAFWVIGGDALSGIVAGGGLNGLEDFFG